jgi:hypothetical protein
MTTTKLALALAALAALAALSACTEKPQSAHTPRNVSHPYEGPATAFTAPGWKVGDAQSWQTQLQVRTQTQNEYVRIGDQPAVQR